MLTITPQIINETFPVLFLASYARLRIFRDPITCGNGCLHLLDCVFAPAEGVFDPRRFVAKISSSVDCEAEPENRFYIIYKGLAVALGVVTVAPLIFYSAWALRLIRRGYEECHCLHSEKTCHLGEERLAPPHGCEGWTYKDGGYQSPDGLLWRKGIRVVASSARVIHRENEKFKRQKMQQKKQSHGRWH